MQIIPLSEQEIANYGATHKLVLTSDDLAAWTSGTGQAVFPKNALGAAGITFGAGTQINAVTARVVTAFASSGGAITTLTLSLGDGGSATRFLNAIDLKTAGYTADSSSLPYVYGVADTLDAVATIAGQTMASLNAGEVHIYMRVLDLTRLA